MSYANRYSRPLGVSAHGWGGAGTNLGIEALAGDTDLVTVFDDFNVPVDSEGFDGTGFEACGWVLTELGGAAIVDDEIAIDDPADTNIFAPSILRIHPGTADDDGGSMQLDRVNAGLPTGGPDFPHLSIPTTTAAPANEALDGTTWVFACRIGFQADVTGTSTDWNHGCYIGWAEAGDTSIMTVGTKAITIDSDGPLVGFHINATGNIDGISHRTLATAMAEGTNFRRLTDAGRVDNTVVAGVANARDVNWFDLALRMDISDMSEDDANGRTRFYIRQVPSVNRPGSGANAGMPGQDLAWSYGGELLNQTPNNDVALVPTIEVINGATAGLDGCVYVDWWSFGCSRLSRMARNID